MLMYAPLYPYFSPPPKMARTISSTSEDRTEGYEFLVRALRAFPAGREWCPALPGTCMFLRGTHRLPENSWSGCFFLRTSGRSFFLSGLILPPLAPAHFQRREVNLQGNHVHSGTLHGHGQPHPPGKMRHFTNNHLMVRIILKPVSHIRPESESFHGNEAFHRNF